MRTSYVCGTCKQTFPRDAMFPFTDGKYYCEKCFEEKKSNTMFSKYVCMLFGLKSPGPRIYTERKRIKNTYGYTDEVIIKTLDYLYNIKGIKKVSETISLVKPSTVDEARKYYKSVEAKNNMLENASKETQNVNVKLVSINSTKQEKNFIDLNSVLEEEEWN